MSYGIIRVQKFKAAAVRGIQSHDRRERESHSNPDIDQGRSAQNYALVECGDLNGAIRERLETLESSKAVRKDAVVMAQCLVTSDHDFFKDLPPDKQRAFFEQSLAFISDRYGKDNILSATVHMDEKTPHMHVNLTPIRDGRLTAKDIFNRQEFNSIHTDFHQAVGQEWGLDRGETRQEKREHLDTQAYKLKTQTEALKQVTAELARLKQETALFQGVQAGTAAALAQAQAWSIEKARAAQEQREKEQRAKEAEKEQAAAKSPKKQRGHGMGR